MVLDKSLSLSYTLLPVAYLLFIYKLELESS